MDPEKTHPITVPLTGEIGPYGAPPSAFPGRAGEAKTKLVRTEGGNEGSERAVVLGLAWLAKQQKDDGGWKYDAGSKESRTAATGMALLPFLAAGQTHKLTKEKGELKYQETVIAGLSYLMKSCAPTGPKAGRMSDNAYEQAIATLALCEAYGMTKDPTLKPFAQSAINYIQKSQGANGSWGYAPFTDGDTSIVGWQVQALVAAKLSKDLVVDDRVIKKAIKFLDLASSGPRKAMYGYADSDGAKPGTALTASGLLSRYYIDGWGPNHPGMCDGVAGLLKHPPPDKADKGGVKDLYYYYYATQVVRFSAGEDWKTWNEGPKNADGTRKGGVRDWLVNAQLRKDEPNRGSWDPEGGWFGTSCGRLGTTAVCVLTLEVYYRQPLLYKRGDDSEAVKMPEDK
ncbi:prenyltransferase/squalene oxidase repeat-containing protein [Frigoriglobus tundricola]|uniref:prenyltransferase/squalene oxidase repeat-containing protein n=1 Tax=Frigoriglobus tundricola TaxID=2774151 RepID=UPI00148EADC5|nr:prenyltransferase/squalene oxidase repeat-containing protein [Frigoriglobus tundricola]